MKKGFFGVALIAWASFSHMPLLSEYINSVSTSLEMNDTGQIGYADVSGSQSWGTFKSAYFTVYYLPQDDLKSIERKLRTRILSAYGRNSYPDNVRSSSEKIAYRLDMLFIRTKELLDMYPDLRINIKIFKTKKELDEEYYNIFDKAREVSSFYVNKSKTIYVCEEDLSDSTIVREMARAVVDQDIGVVLPARVKDMFSSYVNSHLDE
ncbi:MAG: hypothetical protein Q8R38_06480 [Candidatus Omnitrophota bacterium]|nr:hypothetical protein [Candidatus Omnitrophota bacterium]